MASACPIAADRTVGGAQLAAPPPQPCRADDCSSTPNRSEHTGVLPQPRRKPVLAARIPWPSPGPGARRGSRTPAAACPGLRVIEAISTPPCLAAHAADHALDVGDLAGSAVRSAVQLDAFALIPRSQTAAEALSPLAEGLTLPPSDEAESRFRSVRIAIRKAGRSRGRVGTAPGRIRRGTTAGTPCTRLIRLPARPQPVPATQARARAIQNQTRGAAPSATLAPDPAADIRCTRCRDTPRAQATDVAGRGFQPRAPCLINARRSTPACSDRRNAMGPD